MASSRQVAPAFARLAGHPLRWRLLTELARSDLRVRELVDLVGQPQNLVSYHLRLLRGGGLVTAVRSSFDGRDSYYHLDLDRCATELAGAGAALHPALHQAVHPAVHPGLRADPAAATQQVESRPGPRVSVLFVCTGNSARSPIAEALLCHHAAGHVTAISAGTHPKPRLHPDAVRVLRRRFDIDIAAQRPRHLDTLTDRRFDYVISLCDRAREACPAFDGHPRRLHWSVPDPASAGDGPGYPVFARVASDIDTRVRHLLPVLAATDPRGVAS